MESFWVTLGVGFVLGVRHALDADHVMAVSTIVSEQRRIWRSSLIGAFWGLGHTLSLTLVGTLVIMFRWSVSHRTAFWMEMGVAGTLIALGLRLMFRTLRKGGWHTHFHRHGRMIHAHVHGHPDGRLNHAESHHQVARVAQLPFLLGMVHGLAGSAALLLLVLATLRSPWEGVITLIAFGIGSSAGMLMMSTLVGLPLALMAHRFHAISGGIRLAAGFGSVGFGVFLAFRLSTGF